MLTLKSEPPEDLTSLNSPAAKKELEHWERVVFAFDMDREQPPNSHNTRRSRSASNPNSTTGHQHPQLNEEAVNIQDAALLAQFAAAAGSGNLDQAYNHLFSHGAYPSTTPSPGFYNNFLHHNPMSNPMPPPQLPPLSSLDFPWHSLPPQHPQVQASPSHFNPQHASSSTGMSPLHAHHQHYGAPPPPPSPEASRSSSTRGGQGRESMTARPHESSSPEVDPALTDEKRRRNTAASARFRIKKKHRAITLERSVSDLTGRAEELEREVADLRRENGWLKEIVMLKGTQFAANNPSHQQALSQAAAMALGGHSSNISAAGPSNSGSGSTVPPQKESGSESDSSDSEQEASDKKGKGKKPAKSRKR